MSVVYKAKLMNWFYHYPKIFPKLSVYLNIISKNPKYVLLLWKIIN